MVHGTRSKGKQKAPVVVELSSDDEEIAPPPPKRKPPSPQAGPAPPSPPVPSPAPRREPSSSMPPTVHRSAEPGSSEDVVVPRRRATRISATSVSREPSAAGASTSSARASLPPVASTSTAPAQPTARVKAPRPKPKIAGSDDELDDFFTRKPIQAKRIPKGRGAPAEAAPVAAAPPSSEDEDEDADDAYVDNSGPKVKAVKLPEWARSKSGAQKKAEELGIKPNRKRRKMDESDEDDEAAAVDKDDPGEPKAAKVPVLESDSDDSDDSLTYENVPKPDKGKGKGRGPTRERSASMSPPIAAKSSAGTEFQSFQELQEQKKRRRESATIELSDGGDDASEDDASATASPPANPDTTLDFMNDPEYAAMFRGAKAEAQDGSDDVLIVSNDRDASAHLSDAGVEPAGEDDVEVTIHLSLVWDPDRAAPEAVKRNYERVSEYTCGLNEPFERIFAEFADLKAVPKSSLVITHRQLRVYPFGTPKSVEIFHSGDLKAFPQEVYHKLERSKKERVITSKPDSSEPEDEDGDEDLGDVDDLLQRARSVTREASVARAEPDDPTANSDGEGAAPGGTIRVTVRGSQTMTLGLVVKPTTTVVQLLRHYCRHFEIDLAELPGMWAEFEGERLDNAQTLASCDDIEDGQIDVRRAK